MISNLPPAGMTFLTSPSIRQMRARRRLADALGRSLEHGPAQIDQRDIQIRQLLEQLERVVAGSASDVEHSARMRSAESRGLGDQCHGERGIDGGGLTGLEVGKSLDVGVEIAGEFLQPSIS